jgi:raffinose/stachyose/melibiose transport system substrate-binding protein
MRNGLLDKLQASADYRGMIRREFLKRTGLAASGALLTACTGPAPTTPTAASVPPTPAPAAKPTTAPTAAAPAVAATTAPAKPAGQAAAAVQTPTDPGKPVTLEFWGGGPEHLADYQRLMAQFQKNYPSITINVTMAAFDQFEAKLQAALNAGSGPDLFAPPPRPALDEYIKSGFLRDLTNDVDLSHLLPTARDAVVIDGKTWAVPAGAYTVGMMYHKDLFDKAGITKEPGTWAEMKAAMEQLKGKGITPFAVGGKDGNLTYFEYIGLASTVLGTDGFQGVLDGKKKLSEPDMVEVVQTMRDWVPYYQSGYMGTAYADAKALFSTQKTAMVVGGSGDIPGYYELKKDIQLGFFYFPPKTAGGKPATNTGMAGVYAVNAKSANPLAATAWVNWLGTLEGGQVTTDLLKFVPTVQNVKPSGDPVLTKMMQTPFDIPVWYERFPTANLTEVWAKNGSLAFDTSKSVQDFANELQASVDAQLAKRR